MQGNQMVVCVATVFCLVLNFGHIFGISLDTQELAQLGELSDTKPLESENAEDVAQGVWHWPETAPISKRETVPQNQPAHNVPQPSPESGTETDSQPSNKSNTGSGPTHNENHIQTIKKEFPNQTNAVPKTYPNVTLGKPDAGQPPPSNHAVENVIQPVEKVPIDPAIVPQAGEATVRPAIQTSPPVVAGSTNPADLKKNSNLPPPASTQWYVGPPEVKETNPEFHQTSTGNVSSSTILQPVIYLSVSCYIISQFLL